MYKVLVSDKLSEAGLKIFSDESQIELINEPGLGKDPAKLKEVLKNVHAIAIRSATTLTADILEHAPNLKVIGRAGIGVDNVDIPAASKKGIIVMNTPGGNVITTAEHAISMMCALTRSIPQATASMKAGKWEKSRFMGSELYQKTLGVLGCGNIGKIVASRAQGLSMNVISFDPFLTAERAHELGIKKVELDELFAMSDYITVHTPLNEKTKHIVNKQAFQKMKRGVYVINCARGGIISEDDLCWALDEGIVAGAALDVFEQEPVNPEHPLLKSDKVICTPHLGASTEEAQENVSLDVAKQIVDYLVNGNVVNALNAPSASGETLRKIGPFIRLGQKLGSFLGQLCQSAPSEIQINYFGEITKTDTSSITTAALQGLLQPMMSDVSVNAVNAPYIAKERGLVVRETKTNTHSDYTAMIEITLQVESQTLSLAGTVLGKQQSRVVRFNDLETEIDPQGQILVITNQDKPGVVGKVGTALGSNNINISTVQLGLNANTQQATAFYNVTGNLNESVLSALRTLDGVQSVCVVKL